MKKFVISALIIFQWTIGFGQYPKLGCMHFGTDSPPEWYAKFDFVITRNVSSSIAQTVHNLNPNTKIVSTKDWNAGAGLDETTYEQWIVRYSDGSKVTIYGGAQYLWDFTDYCPQISTDLGTKRYNEYLPLYVVSQGNLTYFDGIATDGFWDTPWETDHNGNYDIDLDRDGENDYYQHGENWVDTQWQNGMQTILNAIWAQAEMNGKLLICNSGWLHETYKNLENGAIQENLGALWDFDWIYGQMEDWNSNSKQPTYILLDGWYNSYTHYAKMRFLLCTSLMSNAYFSFSEENLHHYNGWYDEFDIDLGNPTSDAIQVTSTHGKGTGIWVRFFTNGCVILNADSTNATVLDGMINVLPGYDGPYYHFIGGQDPSTNDGSMFTSDVLIGVQKSSTHYWGDGRVLVKNGGEHYISDIIIDNNFNSTSPGSDPAELTGNWTETCDDENNSWAVSQRAYAGEYAIAYAPSGGGSSYAIFRPTIGVAGSYQVYEWHGELTTLSEATNVEYEIHYDGGIATVTVNQSVLSGQWNYLGEWDFDTGTNGYIKIDNDANGYVICDAVKFVYSGNYVPPDDNTPPNAPYNLTLVSKTDNSITMRWNAPSPASDGDLASYYKIYRNGNYEGVSYDTTYSSTGLEQLTIYNYDVYAVDDAGNMSTGSASGMFSTTGDTTGPAIDTLIVVSNNLLKLYFTESVDTVSATADTNYSISGLTINSVFMNTVRSVQIGTSAAIGGNSYTLQVSNVKDLAGNVMEPDSVQYVATAIDSSISAPRNFIVRVR